MVRLIVIMLITFASGVCVGTGELLLIGVLVGMVAAIGAAKFLHELNLVGEF